MEVALVDSVPAFFFFCTNVNFFDYLVSLLEHNCLGPLQFLAACSLQGTQPNIPRANSGNRFLPGKVKDESDGLWAVTPAAVLSPVSG